MAWFAVITVIAATLVLWVLIRRKRHPVDKLPGPPTLPVLGNALQLNKPRDVGFAIFMALAKKYAPLFRLWIGHIPTVIIMDPAEAEIILSSSIHISKSNFYTIMQDWLGTGLLTSGGSKWHSRRKLLTPAFHFKILEQFLPVFSEKTDILVGKLAGYVGKEVDVVPLVTRCALDIICETAMGTNVRAQEGGNTEYVSQIYEVNDLLVDRMMRPWLHPNFIYSRTSAGRRSRQLINSLQGFTTKVITERRLERKARVHEESQDGEIFTEEKRKTAFLDLLLQASEENPNFSDEDIREEVDTFMFEGHDTTANGLSWTLHFLGANLDVQARCAQELELIFSGDERSPTLADLAAMKYLERVIKESLRLRPPVYTVARKLHEPLKMRNIDFPPGTVFHCSIYLVHRHPEHWPEPEKFDPDRFLSDNMQGRHPYSYIPFSAGPRNCIGQKFAMLEMKEVLSSILRRFRLESVDPEHHYSSLWPDLILRPKDGIKLKIHHRN